MSTTAAVSRRLSVDLHLRISPALFERLNFAADRSGLTAPALARAVLSHQLPERPTGDDT